MADQATRHDCVRSSLRVPTSNPLDRHGPTGLLQRAVRTAVQVATSTALTLGIAAAQGGQQPPTPPGATPPPPPTAGAQDPQPRTPRMVSDETSVTFSMNETNGMELTEFIKWAQELTGKRFTFNANDLMTGTQGGGPTVSFLGTFKLKRERFVEDFYAFFQTMLYIKGLAVVPRGEGDLEILEIIAMGGQRGREVASAARYVTPDEVPNYRNQTGVTILTPVPLKNINATMATNALRPFFASTGAPGTGSTLTLGNVGNSSAILLQGFGPQVYAAVELLKLVDMPVEQPNLEVQVIALEHQAPEELEPILTEVLESRSQIRAAVLSENAAGGGGPVAGGSTQPKLKVVVHSSQKALVLSGAAEQVREALELVARLDVPSQPVDGQASVRRLKNVLADDLRQTLNTFLSDDNTAEQQAQTATGPGASAARRTRKTVIQAHSESNSLLISAAGTKWKQNQYLIDQIDVRQPQVLIEAALVELTTGDLDRFGVELGLIDLKDDGDFTRGFGFTSFGQSTFQDTDDDNLPDTRLPDFDNPLQGITGGIISGGDFAVPLLINALSTDDRANILSLPSVLVNNNEEATVKTTESRPTTQSQQGTATTQQSNGPPREAGITLEISPTISPNQYLRLNIKLSVSRFVGAFDPNSVSGGGIVFTRAITTQVTMPDNATMVIGGVIEDSESDNNGGIPLLKDIPLLGYLFRRSESQSNKTNLYFFVTPTILDEPDFHDLDYLSTRKKLEAASFIGDRRLQLIDKRYTPGEEPTTLQDSGASYEDLDRHSGFYNTNSYVGSRNEVAAGDAGAATPGNASPTGPSAPSNPNGANPR